MVWQEIKFSLDKASEMTSAVRYQFTSSFSTVFIGCDNGSKFFEYSVWV